MDDRSHMEDARDREDTGRELDPSDARQVKNLRNASKKTLAREVVRLRHALYLLRPTATKALAAAAHGFQHAEAFAMMAYVEVDDEGVPVPGGDALAVWNSRDGVTPFVLNVDGKRYQHSLRDMHGPVFDRPAEATHFFVTRTDHEVLEAWHRTLEASVRAGRIDEVRADELRDRLDLAEANHYRIGVRRTSDGRYVEEPKQGAHRISDDGSQGA